MINRYSHIAAAILGALTIFTIHMQGFKIINPSYTGWLYVLNSDYSTHYMGWEYFRFLPWDFPFGKLENYAFPMISSIGYTDSIPLLAVLFKMFNAWLPESFQYFGIWLVICYLLQAVFGYLLGTRLSGDPWVGVFSGLFAILSAPLLFRTPHPALCGQWLILASFYAYIYPKTKTSIIWSSLVALVSAWIHPYLFVMCMVIGLSAHLKWLILNKINWVSWILWSTATVLLSYFSLYSIGYFIIQSNQATALGLGEFSVNLNTFFNSQGLSSFLPSLDYSAKGQYEGFAYLGLGLGILWIITLTKKKSWKTIMVKSNLPILLAVGFMTFLALSPNISFGNDSILKFKLNHPVFDTFRSNGRFIWLIFYLGLAASMWTIGQMNSQKVKYLVLAICVLVQFVDLYPLIDRKILMHQDYVSPLSAMWTDLYEEVDKIYLYPPFVPTYATSGDALHFIEVGRKTRAALTTGHLARRDDFIADSLLSAWGDQFREGEGFDSTAIYVMNISSLPLLKNSLDLQMGQVRKLDDYLIFFPNKTVNNRPKLKSIIQDRTLKNLEDLEILRIEEFMQRHDTLFHIISVKDEASQSFCQESRTFFKNINSKLGDIKYRNAYIGLFEGSFLWKEHLAADSLSTEETLPPMFNNVSLDITSAGGDHGNMSSIKVNGTEYSLNQRGFNLVSLNQDGEVVQQVNFDTYTQCAQVFSIMK